MKTACARPYSHKLLLFLSLLFVAGCATDEPTSFIVPPELTPQVEAPPEPPPSEERKLIRGKPTRKANKRTVNPRTVNAVTQFQFEPDKIYKVAVSPGYFTSIYLEPGEKMPGDAAWGDPDNTKWQVGKTFSGTANGKVVVLLIRPGEVGISTNMLIPTDRRTYQVDLTSYAKRAMDMVKWTYPNRDTAAFLPPNPGPGVYEASFDPLMFNHYYEIEVASGNSPSWIPVAAYDFGGTKTYIEFPPRIGQVDAPAVFVIDQNGMATPAQFRARKCLYQAMLTSCYEVDRLFSVAELRQGTTTVRISRTNS